jgi:hypothetical protein
MEKPYKFKNIKEIKYFIEKIKEYENNQKLLYQILEDKKNNPHLFIPEEIVFKIHCYNQGLHSSSYKIYTLDEEDIKYFKNKFKNKLDFIENNDKKLLDLEYQKLKKFLKD